MQQEWHIDGRDVFIQEWHTLNEMKVEEAERRLNLFDELLDALNFVAPRYFTSHAMTPELSEELQNDFPTACELVHSIIAKAKRE